MRTLRKNAWKKLWVGVYQEEEIIYQRDEDGNIEYMEIDGELVPIEIGTRPAGYKIAESFDSNFSTSGGESEATQYGVDVSDYSAKITLEKGVIEMDETSLLWEAEPILNEDGLADTETADWRIVKVSPSQNFVTYLLDKQTK